MSANGPQGKLDLDPGVVLACREAAARITAQVGEEIAGKTSVSVERTVARLVGVDGASDLDVPLPNVLVDHVRDHGELGRGIAYWIGNALLADPQATPQSITEAVNRGELDLVRLPRASEELIAERVRSECERRIARIRTDMRARAELREPVSIALPTQ